MKKTVIITAAIAMAISVTTFSGCSMSYGFPTKTNSDASSYVPYEQKTTETKHYYSEPEQPTTEIWTEPPTEPPTEPSTEDTQALANRAYYEYLSDHYDLFNNSSSYSSSYDDHIIAFKDLDNDGTDEMVCTRYTDSRHLYTNLCILSYKYGELKTLYDDELFAHAGAEAGYIVFISDDLELYSVLAQHPHNNVTKYEITSSGVKAEKIARTEGEGTGNPEVDCYIGSNRVTRSEYDSFVDNTKSTAKEDLCFSSNNAANIGANNLSMSYSEAYRYLRNNS